MPLVLPMVSLTKSNAVSYIIFYFYIIKESKLYTTIKFYGKSKKKPLNVATYSRQSEVPNEVTN